MQSERSKIIVGGIDATTVGTGLVVGVVFLVSNVGACDLGHGICDKHTWQIGQS
jgi:hypothetical protein